MTVTLANSCEINNNGAKLSNVLANIIVSKLPATPKMDSENTNVGVLDKDGYAICPDCFTCVHCGTVGIANLEKRH